MKKIQKDKQRSTTHRHKTEDQVTRTSLKTDIIILNIKCIVGQNE